MWDASMSKVDLQKELIKVFKYRDADIRMRGDDLSVKAYINRRYPVVRCADPYHEVDYEMRIIIADADET